MKQSGLNFRSSGISGGISAGVPREARNFNQTRGQSVFFGQSPGQTPTQQPYGNGMGSFQQYVQPAARPAYYQAGFPNAAMPKLGRPLGETRPQKPEQPGLLGQLKTAFLDFFFEEVEESPVGIAQLNRQTFQAATPDTNSIFFRNNQPIQDYRFARFIEGKYPSPNPNANRTH